jgi:hypothetical protein
MAYSGEKLKKKMVIKHVIVSLKPFGIGNYVTEFHLCGPYYRFNVNV